MPWVEKVYPVISPNQVTCMLQDRSGNLWVGTGGAGAYKYDGEFFTQVLEDEGKVYDDGLHHNWIHSMVEDLAGNIWVTSMSYGRVSRYDGKNHPESHLRLVFFGDIGSHVSQTAPQ